MNKYIFAACVLALAQTFPQGPHYRFEENGKCGYESCPKTESGKLNVHLVPHSHDDVGWLKTVDQYYYGSKSNIQNAGVQYIIDSVVSELQKDPKKKFVYVELAYFWKWWLEQDSNTREIVKEIVKNGQLEFIGGAWSMNDEATTHYQCTIDQFTWGFRKLNDTFGTCGQPRIGWQIDPFGHSKEMASLMAHLGFDGLFFGRLDYQDKDNRMEKKTMEMIWEGSNSLGSKGDLLTGALYNHYSAPSGFCFDVLCDEPPLVDNPESPEYNVELKVDLFLSHVRLQRSDFVTNNIMLTMGDDFNYQDAHRYFKNLDVLIRYFKASGMQWDIAGFVSLYCINLGSNSHLFTGALFNLYQAPRGFCFDILCGDEPIIDDIYSADYNLERRVNEFLKFIEDQNQAYKNNEILITMGGDFNYQDAHYYFKNLDKLVRAVNERQKNGSKVNVFYSTPSCYVRSLHEANLTWPIKQDDFFPYGSDPNSYWTGYYTSRPTLKYFERLGNRHLQVGKQLSSLAHIGQKENPDLDALREVMGVMQHHDAITGTEKQAVAFDYARLLNDAINKCDGVSNAGLNKIMSKENPNVPPLTFKSCLLLNISQCWVSADVDSFIATVYNPLSRPVDFFVRLPVPKKSFTVRDGKGVTIDNQIIPIPASLIKIPGRTSDTVLELVFKAEAIPGLGYRSYYITRQNAADDSEPQPENLEDVEEIILANDDTELTLNATTGLLSFAAFGKTKISLLPELEYYIGISEYNERSSGAYVFRPQEQHSFKITDKVNITLYKGPIVTEIHKVFSPWASQVVRQYAGDSAIEIEWLVGPIPQKHEVISKFTTDINNFDIFHTDSNGRQTLERKRNYRPTWRLNLSEPVAGNYYPITTDISINDGEVELTVLTDRAQGGGSIQNGTLELMVHRRTNRDDGFGVNEALNEMAYGVGLVARGKHWVIAGQLENPEWIKQKNFMRQEKVLSPQVFLTDAANLDFDKWSKTYKTEFSGLAKALPPEVQILTLEPWKEGTYLLRLEHLFEKKEWNQIVTVDLSNLFSTFDILSVEETALGADRWLKDVKRLKWMKESNEIVDEEESLETAELKFPQIELAPKQIRTFLCKIRPKTKF